MSLYFMPNNIVFLLTLLIGLLTTVLYFSIDQREQSHDIPVPDFSSYKDVVKKKKAFFAYLLPEIRKQNDLVLTEREQVIAMHERVLQGRELLGTEQGYLDELRLKYRIGEELSNKDASAGLIKRVDIIPAELILVQAANESGWGTSRFSRKGYNFFGLW